MHSFHFPFKRESKRIASFHKEFEEKNITRKINNKLENWKYTPLNEAKRIASFANEFSEHVKVVELNVDYNPEIAANYTIKDLPTLLLFNNGKLVHQILGAVSKTILETSISPYLAP